MTVAVINKPVSIGDGTKIWHFSHISENVKIGKNFIIGQNVFVGKGVIIGARDVVSKDVPFYVLMVGYLQNKLVG